MAEPIAASWERGGAYGGKPGKGRRLRLQAGKGGSLKPVLNWVNVCSRT